VTGTLNQKTSNKSIGNSSGETLVLVDLPLRTQAPIFTDQFVSSAGLQAFVSPARAVKVTTATLPDSGLLVRTSYSATQDAIAFDLIQTHTAGRSDVRSMDLIASALQGTEFKDDLNRLRDQLQEQLHFDKNLVASSIALTTGLSVGYVLWLVRGGVLLSSVLSSLPAWRLVDPLPVMAYLMRSKKNDEEDEDSFEEMLGTTDRSHRTRRIRDRLRGWSQSLRVTSQHARSKLFDKEAAR
jgi:hypothetical protein